MSATYHIGTCGWHYPHWSGLFYPAGLPPDQWLAYYAQHFGTVEINNSFYRLPEAHAVRAWLEQTPDGFVFAMKASRYITHRKKLKDPAKSLEAFLSVAEMLGKKRGPVLFQLPPHWRCNPARLDEFLCALPVGLTSVFELRDHSWHNQEVYQLLRQHNAAFCIYELAGFCSPVINTADFAYVRLHGPAAAYSGCYSRQALRKWAQRLHAWTDLRAVYIYFDNDESAYATRNALGLQALLEGKR
jgi:uncharacterized protein YecE (DUF72 family)